MVNVINSVSTKQLKNSIDVQKDFYKSELLKMGYFKTTDGKQLYELSLHTLTAIYKNEKSNRREN